MGGGGWYKPIIGYNSNSTLGGVELTWSGDVVEMELGVELELGNLWPDIFMHAKIVSISKPYRLKLTRKCQIV